eukprot:6950992-Karenia_brevis.AAC.1
MFTLTPQTCKVLASSENVLQQFIWIPPDVKSAHWLPYFLTAVSVSAATAGQCLLESPRLYLCFSCCSYACHCFLAFWTVMFLRRTSCKSCGPGNVPCLKR